MADPICPTYAAGTYSVMSSNSGGDILNDSASGSGSNGYTNEYVYSRTVGAFNNEWANSVLSKNITPTYTTSLLQFGNTGLQS